MPPIEQERKLQAQASSKGLKGRRADAYVYGTLRKMGWKPAREQNSSPPSKAPLK